MVAMNVWPTDGGDGAVATEARWRAMARAWAASGVISGSGGGGEFGCSAFTGAYATINAGAAWVDGHYCELLSATSIPTTANGLIVVRVTPATNTAEIVFRDGATQCQQTPTGIYEIPILKVSAGANQDARAIVLPTGGVRFTNLAARDAWTAAQAATIPTGLQGFVTGLGQYDWHGAAWWLAVFDAAYGIAARMSTTAADGNIGMTELPLCGGAVDFAYTASAPSRWVRVGVYLVAKTAAGSIDEVYQCKVNVKLDGALIWTFRMATHYQAQDYSLVMPPTIFAPGPHNITFTANAMQVNTLFQYTLGLTSWLEDLGSA